MQRFWLPFMEQKVLEYPAVLRPLSILPVPGLCHKALIVPYDLIHIRFPHSLGEQRHCFRLEPQFTSRSWEKFCKLTSQILWQKIFKQEPELHSLVFQNPASWSKNPSRLDLSRSCWRQQTPDSNQPLCLTGQKVWLSMWHLPPLSESRKFQPHLPWSFPCEMHPTFHTNRTKWVKTFFYFFFSTIIDLMIIIFCVLCTCLHPCPMTRTSMHHTYLTELFASSSLVASAKCFP